MDTNGHISIQGEAFGRFRVQINFVIVPTGLAHIVVALGRGTWDRKIQEVIENKHPRKFWDERPVLFRKTKIRIAAFAISTDSKGGWTDVDSNID